MLPKNTQRHNNTEIRLIIFFAAKDEEALYSQQKQDRELTVAQIKNSLLPNSDLNKVGKTTRPFRYDLNQIPNKCTVEVRNRFKGLDLTLYRRQGARPFPRKLNAKKQNGYLRRLTNSCEKKRSEKQRRKGKIYLFECRVLKNSKER